MKLTVIAAFSWAHRGVQVEHFAEGQVIETDDEDLIDVSQREGWTSPPSQGGQVAAEAVRDDSPVVIHQPEAPPAEASTPAPTEAPPPAPAKPAVKRSKK